MHPELNTDLFATRLNNQLTLYCSWKPDPGCASVDALTIDWSKFNLYVSSPFSLIRRFLQKIAQDQAKGILIIPLWPTQTWFSQALQPAMPSTLDIETPEEPTATCQPTSTPTAQQAAPNGLSALRESFTQYNVSPDITKILMASWRVGTQNNTKHTLKNVWHIVIKEASSWPFTTGSELLHYKYGTICGQWEPLWLPPLGDPIFQRHSWTQKTTTQIQLYLGCF